ncbi:hypothetical protein GQR58_017158 [Nymphon striatum]|nr:hypothetical protein GQR58_017158 [Nymphon striatum]
MLENNWTNPFSNQPSDLVSLSTGAAATSAITSDLLKARSKGEEAFKIHKERLESGSGFFDPIKKQNLQTFTVLQKNTVVNAGTNREMILKADNRVFGNMLLIVDMLENNWTNPFSNQPSDLVSLSTGAAATSAITSDLLKARSKGEEAFKIHKERLESGSGFFPIKKQNLQTFTVLQKNTVVNAGTNREMILKADNRVFGNMLLIAQSRKLDMKDVLQYPLGPKPWALANADGTLKKTGKATLGKHLEKEVANVDVPSGSCATIVDAMAIVQMIPGSRADKSWFQMWYHVNQIKPGHRIKNWKRILASTESKAKLTIFLAENWKEECRRSKLGSIILMVTTGEQCFKITKDERFRRTGGQIYPFDHQEQGIPGNVLRFWEGMACYRGYVRDYIFTCSLYCLNTSISDVNKLRYEMFRSRKGDISSGQLPPCKDALKQQTNRANYQAAIWRRSLQNSPEIPSPTNGHGWNVVEGKLGICWLTGAPAPDVVLELMSCKCPRRCNENLCGEWLQLHPGVQTA